jgi:hypothetical protein
VANGKHAPAAPPPRAIRLPDDFTLDTERIAYAKAQGVDPTRTFENFSDYWRSKAGDNKKLNWDLTWKRWCREEASRPGNGTKVQRRAKTVAELEAEEHAKH